MLMLDLLVVSTHVKRQNVSAPFIILLISHLPGSGPLSRLHKNDPHPFPPSPNTGNFIAPAMASQDDGHFPGMSLSLCNVPERVLRFAFHTSMRLSCVPYTTRIKHNRFFPI